MKKHTFRFPLWMTIIVVFGFLITGCKYYRYAEFQKDTPSAYIGDQKSGSLLKNHFVLHHNGEMQELTNVQIDKSKRTIEGDPISFGGLQRAYYDKALNSGKTGAIRRRRGRENSTAVNQLHLYVEEYSVPEESGGNRNLATATLNFDDISKIEILKNDVVTNSVIVAGAVAGTTVGAAAIFLAIACGCPHVYIHNGAAYEYHSTLFTGAITPQLERNDYKILPDFFKDSLRYGLQIVNEEDENQYTNLLELMAVYHDENTEVVVDKEGVVHTITNPITPHQALDNSGNNILDKISKADEDAYRFDADSLSGLSEAFVTFSKPADQSSGKLILRLKNSRWSGYVYDQFNSMFGKRYAEWVRKNEDKPKEDRLKWMKEQGINLLVDRKTADGWENVDLVDLVGDVSHNTIVVPMKFSPANNQVELRIRSGFMFWEVDYIGMDYSTDIPLKVQRLKPLSAISNSGQDFVSELATDDESYMSHLGRGASSTIEFEPIKKQEGTKRTLFLHSKGYYTFQKEYSGKTYRWELAKFKRPGELSRFSKKLYTTLTGDLVIAE